MEAQFKVHDVRFKNFQKETNWSFAQLNETHEQLLKEMETIDKTINANYTAINECMTKEEAVKLWRYL